MGVAVTYAFYGLEIRRVSEFPTQEEIFDVSWTNQLRSSCSYDGLGSVRSVFYGVEQWTRHVFASGVTTFAEFDVSPDGRSVRSWACSDVEPENLEELFLETVMRTVLCRLGHPAVHASALEKDGKAVLLLGEKGAGKSTLAASLQANGWHLIADDLVRLRRDQGKWCALPGMQRNKLLPDSMCALGYVPEAAERRWKGKIPAGVAEESVAKLLLQADEPIDSSASFPVAAVLCLTDRQQNLNHPSVTNLQPREAVFFFSEHLIRDPLPPYAPPRLAGTMVGELAGRSLVWRAALPNDLQQLQKSAVWLDNFLTNGVTAASAPPEAK